MTRRSLRVWMFVVALLPALASAARATAKPPDLPVNPNDTTPILTPPPFELSPPATEVAPPLPEPLPGWPTITIYSGPGGFIGEGDPSCFQPEVHPTTLTFYPGPRGTCVSIDPSPMSAPQTMTIYHPVRPRVPLSVLYTFDECLLFSANPLLTLVPLPESLREERHTQEIVPVPPMPQMPPDGSPMFGLLPEPPASSTLTPDLSIPLSPSTQDVGDGHNSDAPPVCSCPSDRFVPAIANIELSNRVLENLEKMIEAEALYQEACQFVQDAQYAEAMDCLKKAWRLCPASRYQEMAAEVVSSMVWRVFSGHREDADTEEEDVPLIECEPYWYDDAPCCSPQSKQSHECPPACGMPCEKVPAVEKQEVPQCGSYDFSGIGMDVIIQRKSSPKVEMKHKLAAPVTFSFKDVPLRQAIGNLCQRYTVNIDTDDTALLEAGIRLDQPVTLRLESMTLKTALELLLKRCNLCYIVKESHIEITTKEHARGPLVQRTYTVTNLVPSQLKTPEELVKLITNTIEPNSWVEVGGCGTIDYFPHCQALVISQFNDIQEQVADLLQALRHLAEKENQAPCCRMSCDAPCKSPGVEVQVTGLMKACHLALGCGQHAKAAQLAREAYALDAERVAADPIVYKMHLLALKMDKGKCCCDDDCCCDPCDNPNCCCHAKEANKQLPPLPSCPVVELMPPTLPPVDPAITVELQKLFDEANVEVSKAKPNLEVVEEESEAPEAPKALAKPFRVQAAQTETIITYDDLLRFLPGETWTEIDLKTNRVRVLWRMHVGDKVYRVRYDGGLSVDLNVMPPMGSAEKCEDPR